MSYSNLYFQSKKKTSLILVACAALSIIGFLLFVFKNNSLPTRASKKQLKSQSTVNVGARQAGVYWQSDESEVGWVLYGTSPQNLNTIALDERDVESQKNKYTFHYASLNNLGDKTQYYYRIVSGNELISSNDGSPFAFRTSSSSSNTSALKPVYGKIIRSNGEPVQNTIVILQFANAYPLLTLTKLTGEWLIPLQYAINKNTNTPIFLTSKDTVKITITAEDTTTTQINAKISNISPLPQTLVLGKHYTFMEETNVLPASTQYTTGNSRHVIDILYPKEGSIIPGNKPLIKGLGVPGTKVKAIIQANPGYIYETTVDHDGSWIVDSSGAIAPGYYTLIVKAQDDNGKQIQLSRRFTIGKSGEQVLGDATPSATLTPTAIITISPTASISATPTYTPTPTTVMTTAPSASPTGLLRTGLNINPFMWGSAALIVIGAGVLLLF